MAAKKRTLAAAWGIPEPRREGSANAARHGHPVVFCDLDGVLADFETGVMAVTGRLPDQMQPRYMWPLLARAPDFYTRLPWMKDGKQLWEFIKGYKPAILTGLPLGQWAAPQKRRWCQRELGKPSDVPVITCMSRDKHTYCRVPGSILIDDRITAKDPWEAAGGVFVFHTSAQQSIAELQKLLPPLVPEGSEGAESKASGKLASESTAGGSAKGNLKLGSGGGASQSSAGGSAGSKPGTGDGTAAEKAAGKGAAVEGVAASTSTVVAASSQAVASGTVVQTAVEAEVTADSGDVAKSPPGKVGRTDTQKTAV
eukprot:TRINITY_DN2980_c0_g1_i4.p1 TRINITY_DN2980_c0_g1~~TRINITY_DN2980_c0_g1_i4.p1  ORF type:complete len:367 (+),score=59.27 TRINITY_DN2980_c0_g1_i4:166-1101(+)